MSRERCWFWEEPEQLVDGLERRRVVGEARDVANKAEATFFDDLRGNRRVQLVQFGIRDAFVPADLERSSEPITDIAKAQHVHFGRSPNLAGVE